jgi:rhodanese-related sulfurtransferase
MSKHLSVISIAILLLLIFLPSVSISIAEDQPIWWDQAKVEAEKEGYALITLSELKSWYDAGKPFLILDVRPDYEYQRGHLPNAVNLEFDLGERLTLKPEKRKTFEELLGPDKDRTVVIYCRSFR